MSVQTFIEENKAEFPVKLMCEVLEVSRSWVYDRAKRKQCDRKLQDVCLQEKIAECFEEHNSNYGSPRIHEDLKAKGIKVGRKRVARLMIGKGLRALRKRKSKKTTDSNHAEPIAPNLIQRDFTAEAPNKVWVTDITYIQTTEGWLYLVLFIDLFSRRIVSYAIDTTMETELVLRGLRNGIRERHPEPGLIIHSDRGSQYASCAFRDLLRASGFIQSMSSKGDCWDNAVAESVNGTIKRETKLNEKIETEAKTLQMLYSYLGGYYNSKRLHSYLGYKTPDRYERDYEVAMAA